MNVVSSGMFDVKLIFKLKTITMPAQEIFKNL